MLGLANRIGIDLIVLLGIMSSSAAILIVAYRRFIISLFDPLCFFLIVLISDTCLMLSLPWDTNLKWEYIGFVAFFWAGFLLRGPVPASHPTISFRGRTLFELEFILVALFVLIVAGNLFLGVSSGFPLLSNNPGVSKFTVYTGGVGIVRRINMGPYYFFCGGSILLAVIGHKRRQALILLAIATGFVLLGGSKGTLLPIIYLLTFVVSHRGLSNNDRLRMRAAKYTVILLLVGACLAILITTKDQGSFSAGLAAFFGRFLLSGDCVLFYFPQRKTIMSLVNPTVIGYLHNLFADLFGMLRIWRYETPLGSLMLGSTDDVGGPNVQYFIQADLFFGPILGLGYCLIIGYVIASLRARFFGRSTKSGIWFIINLVLACAAFDLAIEAGLFVVDIASMIMTITPLWILARLTWMSASYSISRSDGGLNYS